MIEITTIFNDFFRYQVDIKSIAAACKKCGLDTFWKVAAAITAYFHQDDLSDDRKVNAKIICQNLIQLEFIKALTYQICRINNILY